MWRQVFVVCSSLLILFSDTNGEETCIDYLGSQCQDRAVQEVVCKDINSAPQFCEKTCGLCPTTKPSTDALSTKSQIKLTSPSSTAKLIVTTANPTDKTTVTTAMPTDKTAVTTTKSTVPTVKATAACVDEPTSHCDPKYFDFVCADVHFSKFCPKMCGQCGSTATKALVTMTTQETTLATSPITYRSTLSSSTSHSGKLQCTNAPDATCNDPTLLRIICSQLDTALRFCAKSCGVCGKTLPSTQMTTMTRYMSTTIRTTLTSTCTDSTDVKCTDPQVQAAVCLDPVMAAKLCPKTCGRCAATTVDTCQDDPSGKCQDPVIKSFVCLDQDTASKLCPKTCNVCSKQNSGAPVVG